MINLAIVGTGTIAVSHAQAYMKFPQRCRIVALCNDHPRKAEALKQKFKLDCDIYSDYKQMLDCRPDIQLVDICTPPFVHAEMAIASMNAGRHVVVEKPMAVSLAECDAMLEAEKRNKVVLSCIAQNRFKNPVYKLKRVADSGIAGKISCINVKSYWWRDRNYYDLWWRGLWDKEGGGPTLNHAIHHIDILNWIKGRLPLEVMAMLANVMHDNSELEDLSMAVLRYDDGTLAQVTSSVLHHGEEQGIELQCARAKIALPWDVKAELGRPDAFPSEAGNKELVTDINEFYNALPELPYEGHTGQIDDILNAIEMGTRPMVTAEDGRRAIELITAIYKSGLKKELVKLPIDPEDEFYTFEGFLRNVIRFNEKKSLQ